MDDKEKLEREAIVKEALEWQKTPYIHMGRVKGAGTDCGMYLLGVWENCGLLPHIDVPYYPFDIAANCSSPMYLNFVEKYCHKVDREALPGDILLYKFPGSRTPHHCSIVVDEEFCVHSYVRQGIILSNRRGYKQHEVGLYSFNGWG
jgi:cell wall-associated NlpC family hydrolase